MDNDPISVQADDALILILAYKNRNELGNSWAHVERAIKKRAHKYCFLIDRKKLRFWETRGTVPKEQPYEAICDFILSDHFREIVPERDTCLFPRKKAFECGENFKEFFDYGFKHPNAPENLLNDLSGFWLQRGSSGTFSDEIINKERQYTFFRVIPCKDKSFSYTHIYFSKSVIALAHPEIDYRYFFSGYIFINDKEEIPKLTFMVWNRVTKNSYRFSFDLRKVLTSIRRIQNSTPEKLRQRNLEITGRDFPASKFDFESNRATFLGLTETESGYSSAFKPFKSLDMKDGEKLGLSMAFDSIKYSVVSKDV